jgi:hypothetical protein
MYPRGTISLCAYGTITAERRKAKTQRRESDARRRRFGLTRRSQSAFHGKKDLCRASTQFKTLPQGSKQLKLLVPPAGRSIVVCCFAAQFLDVAPSTQQTASCRAPLEPSSFVKSALAPGSQVRQALIGENPPAEKIESRDGGDSHNSPEWGTNKTRDFKNFAHYIPPTHCCLHGSNYCFPLCGMPAPVETPVARPKAYLSPKHLSPQALSSLSVRAAATQYPLLAGSPLSLPEFRAG